MAAPREGGNNDDEKAMIGGKLASPSSNALMCRQWWKVCWMYGDQNKYYRQLYGGGRPKAKDEDGASPKSSSKMAKISSAINAKTTSLAAASMQRPTANLQNDTE